MMHYKDPTHDHGKSRDISPLLDVADQAIHKVREAIALSPGIHIVGLPEIEAVSMVTTKKEWQCPRHSVYVTMKFHVPETDIIDLQE